MGHRHQHVAAGSASAEARRKSARERLEKHLKDHRANHAGIGDEDFRKHDAAQKAELSNLKTK